MCFFRAQMSIENVPNASGSLSGIGHGQTIRGAVEKCSVSLISGSFFRAILRTIFEPESEQKRPFLVECMCAMLPATGAWPLTMVKGALIAAEDMPAYRITSPRRKPATATRRP